MRPAADPMQSLWIGPRLSAMERLSIASFLRFGHPFHLYAYDHVDGVPDGTTLRDAREILPADRIFVYRDFPSVSGFSNVFRYALLRERGGWWVDTDVVCLAPFAFDGEHVFASERVDGVPHVASAVIRAPRNSEAMTLCAARCEALDPSTLHWGETGPRLLAEVVDFLGLRAAVQPPEVFCPLPYDAWRRLLDAEPPALPPSAVALHLWNEMWRRDGAGKDAAFDPRCLYERLKKEMRVVAESAIPAG